MDTQKERLKNYVITNFLFGDETRAPEETDSFIEKGIIDSTGVLELVSFLQEEFAIRVEDDEIVPENLDSISKLTQFVQRKTAQVQA